MKGNGELASSDREKAEVLNECFASVFTGSQAFCVCQHHEPLGEGVGSGFCPTVAMEQGRVLLTTLNVYKSREPDDIHPRVLKAMALTCLVLLLLQNAPGECVVLHSCSLPQDALSIAAARQPFFEPEDIWGYSLPYSSLLLSPASSCLCTCRTPLFYDTLLVVCMCRKAKHRWS